MKKYKDYYCCIKEGEYLIDTLAETKELSKERLIKQFVKKSDWTEMRKLGYSCTLVNVEIYSTKIFPTKTKK